MNNDDAPSAQHSHLTAADRAQPELATINVHRSQDLKIDHDSSRQYSASSPADEPTITLESLPRNSDNDFNLEDGGCGLEALLDYRTEMDVSVSSANTSFGSWSTLSEDIFEVSEQPWAGEYMEHVMQPAGPLATKECSSIPGDRLLDDLWWSIEPSHSERIICAQCGRRFDTFVRLEQHGKEARHFAFRCSYPGCIKMLKRRDTLKRHLDNHRNPPLLRCKLCAEQDTPKMFKRKDHLAHHLKRCHRQRSQPSAEDMEKKTLRELLHSLHNVSAIDDQTVNAVKPQIEAMGVETTQLLLKELGKFITLETRRYSCVTI